MGVERAITRWYLQRQMILNEIALLESQIAQKPTSEEPGIQSAGPSVVDVSLASATGGIVEVVDAQRQLALAQAKLKALGHCPKPMMG